MVSIIENSDIECVKRVFAISDNGFTNDSLPDTSFMEAYGYIEDYCIGYGYYPPYAVDFLDPGMVPISHTFMILERLDGAVLGFERRLDGSIYYIFPWAVPRYVGNRYRYQQSLNKILRKNGRRLQIYSRFTFFLREHYLKWFARPLRLRWRF